MFPGRTVFMCHMVMVNRIRLCLAGRMEMNCRLACPACRLARHGGCNRAPNGEQHRKNKEKDDAKKFHGLKMKGAMHLNKRALYSLTPLEGQGSGAPPSWSLAWWG